MSDESQPALIRGDFYTDGTTFVFKLADTPISGVGDSPSAAFKDLIRAKADSGSLPLSLAALAREQRGEQVRATVVRSTMIGLIVFGVLAGTLVATAAMLPKVAADLVQVGASRISEWVKNAPSENERRVVEFVRRVSGAASSPDATCPAPASSSTPGTK